MAGNPLQDYYVQAKVDQTSDVFGDFDSLDSFKKFDSAISQPDTRNFLVDFGEKAAYCAVNLQPSTVGKLLVNPRPTELHTRWINIWLPHEELETIKELARHYDFSPRLYGVMRSPPVTHDKASPSPEQSRHSLFRSSNYEAGRSRRPQYEPKDIEEHAGRTPNSTSTQMGTSPNPNHYQIVNDVWHWSSVDWGRKYVSLGYNSLYNIQPHVSGRNMWRDGDGDLPDGRRVWTWLIHCDENTVITIQEDPYPSRNKKRLGLDEKDTLTEIRQNFTNVFRQLSKAHDSDRDDPLLQLPIRKRVGDSEAETVHRPTDAPGLLFYCLFDDWRTGYSLVVRRDHYYAAKLNDLREQMLERAELDHVKRLHYIGRQLAVLKRVYQSYENIIEQLLQKQEATLASLKNSHVLSGESTGSLSSSQPQLAESESLLGVSLSSAARQRFERLRDRIKLYVLSEIQECLDQKESLVMMNFNLIAIKESNSVERLTRVTLLLAKVTILFMPVSLMTAYFSTQIDGAKFTFKAYWISFAVILFISILALVVFGFVSGTMEGKLIYRSLSRALLDMWKERRKMKEQKEQ